MLACAGKLGERRLVDVGGDDRGAGSGEGERGRPADALRGRRDQHRLSVEVRPSLSSLAFP